MQEKNNELSFLAIKPIQRSQIVAAQLMERMHEQKLQIGDKLPPEREMAKAMNVSRNTLRAAIAALQLLGFFEVRRSSGVYLVKQPDTTEVMGAVDDLYAGSFDPHTAIDARIAIEPGAAILASRYAEPKDWELLEKIFTAMKQAIQEGNYRHYMLADNTFHRAIARATHNGPLINALIPILDSMRQPIWRNMKTSIHTPEIWGVSHREHRLILESLRSGDEYMIYRSVANHLTRSKRRLTVTVDEQEEADEKRRDA